MIDELVIFLLGVAFANVRNIAKLDSELKNLKKSFNDFKRGIKNDNLN